MFLYPKDHAGKRETDLLTKRRNNIVDENI